MVTAVELGPDTCVLVRAALRGGHVRVTAVETLDPNTLPGVDAFASALKDARRAHRLPRRARVVLWGLKDGAGPRDGAVQPQLAPFAAAGFRVERIVSPCDALAALARIRTPRPDAAIAWVAVDRAGVALVVARPGELLYSHAFNWDSSIGARGSQARLLQRYSLVSYLAPELKRAAARAQERGARLDAVITCGNLADLRSLTMPLIEELDLEVETLDSLDGLEVSPGLLDRAADLAPAIRLACAGVAARPVRIADLPATRRTGARAVRLFRAAALIAAAVVVGWLLYSRDGPILPADPRNAARPSSPATAPAAAPSGTTQSPITAPATPPNQPAAGPTVLAPLPQVDGSSTAATRGSAAAPAAIGTERPPARSPTLSAAESASPGVTSATSPVLMAPAPSSRAGNPPRPQPQEKQELLDEPLPKVSTILVSDGRPLAMIDGRVLGVGDRVGRRVIAAIEAREVVLREPSGAHVRVRVGGTRELFRQGQMAYHDVLPAISSSAPYFKSG